MLCCTESRRFTHPPQAAQYKPWPGAQNMMQADNSKQALNYDHHHVQPSKMKEYMETPLLMEHD